MKKALFKEENQKVCCFREWKHVGSGGGESGGRAGEGGGRAGEGGGGAGEGGDAAAGGGTKEANE